MKQMFLFLILCQLCSKLGQREMVESRIVVLEGRETSLTQLRN